MPKVYGVVSQAEFLSYNQGYSDGYNKQTPMPESFPPSGVYLRAFITGMEDRIEDERALELGEFDLLDEEERKFLYGDEVDHV